MDKLPKGDKGLNEPTRRCSNPRCKHLLTVRDEQKGKCPYCRQLLLSLSARPLAIEGSKHD
jgi:hypothetical protein